MKEKLMPNFTGKYENENYVYKHMLSTDKGFLYKVKPKGRDPFYEVHERKNDNGKYNFLHPTKYELDCFPSTFKTFEQALEKLLELPIDPALLGWHPEIKVSFE